MAKKQNFIHGAAILTVGVIIMKLLGFIYKISSRQPTGR